MLHPSSRHADGHAKQPTQEQIDDWIEIGLFAICLRSGEVNYAVMKAMGDPGTERFPRAGRKERLEKLRKMLDTAVDEYLEKAKRGVYGK
jgi:trehalose utilization protein